MRPRFITIIRRSLIGVIFFVLAAVLFNYFQTWRGRSISARKPPQILSSDALRSAEGLEYFDYKAGDLRFKIRATRLLETREGKNHLEGIEAYGFNPDGSIRNEIHSRNAVYDHDHSAVDFLGDVQLFLSHGIELRTDSLHYDLNTNIGTTRDALQFRSPEGGGTARGVHFNQNDGRLELKSDVDFVLARREAAPENAGSPEKLHATSERAYCSETSNRVLFQGKARIESASGSLSGESIEVLLSPEEKRVTSLNAAGGAEYQSENAGEKRVLSGERMAFDIGASGALERIEVSNPATFSSTSSSAEMDLRGSEIDLDFDSTGTVLSRIQSRSEVRFRMSSGAKQTLIAGDQLAADFMPGTNNLQSLEVRERASFSVSGAQDSSNNELRADSIRIGFRDRNGNSAAEKLSAEGSAQWRFAAPGGGTAHRDESWKLAASRLEMLYSGDGQSLESGVASGNVVISGNPSTHSSRVQARRMRADSVRFRFFPKNNVLRDLDAEGGVQTSYEEKPGPASESVNREFRTSSDKLHAVFEVNGGSQTLRSMSQWGNFRYEDSSRSATAGKCDYDAETEMLTLSESPVIHDELGATSGNLVRYDQKGRVLSVRGSVRSALGAGKGAKSPLSASSSPTPVIITAEELKYWTEKDRALYTGKAQLLAEDQQLQAHSLDLFEGGRRLEAEGDVLHLLYGEKTSESAARPKRRGKAENSAGEFMTVRSSKLEYLRETSSLKYSGRVSVKSGEVEVHSDDLDAVLDEKGENVERATARGNVLIRQGDRECKGKKADWYLNPGKFVVVGDPAEAYDPERGRSFARRLTSFTTDDRILLESR